MGKHAKCGQGSCPHPGRGSRCKSWIQAPTCKQKKVLLGGERSTCIQPYICQDLQSAGTKKPGRPERFTGELGSALKKLTRLIESRARGRRKQKCERERRLYVHARVLAEPGALHPLPLTAHCTEVASMECPVHLPPLGPSLGLERNAASDSRPTLRGSVCSAPATPWAWEWS